MDKGGICLQVPAFDITRQNQILEPALGQAFQTVLQHGHFILGDEVQKFEKQAADFLGARHAVAVANGSDALVLSLMALGIGPGDEVIVPSFTFFATASSVSRVGAIPVFADVAQEDYNIHPEAVSEKITSKTKAVIVVDLFGMPAKMNELMKLAAAKGLYIIEDAAQALGTVYSDKMVGSIGTLGCFSFFPTKNLGCFGDGGMVTTNQEDLAEKLRMLRVHGARRKYYHESLGINSRLDTLQAAFLNIKLPHVKSWIERRRKIAEDYRRGLADISAIRLPAENDGHSYNQFTIQAERREELQNFLAQNGISTTVYYPLSLHLQPIFSSLGYQMGDLPVSEALTNKVLSLPMFPELTSEEQKYVIEKINCFYGSKSMGVNQ
jgi:dTDP-4-amino-4,6-dideoxygalactose transaminase